MKIIQNQILTGIIILLVLSIATLAVENQQAILAGNLVDVVEGKIRKKVLIVIEKDKIIKITFSDEKSKYPNLGLTWKTSER